MKKQLQGVIGIIEKDGKYLFGLESKASPISGRWRLLGGKLEEGESYQQAMVRECLEEAGIEVKVDGYLTRAPGNFSDILIDVCYGHHISGELKPKLDELSQVRWMNFDEALRMDVEDISMSAFCEYLLLSKGDSAEQIAERAKEVVRYRHSHPEFGGSCGCGASD